MLCGLAAVLQASGFDSVAFDPFSFQQDGLTTPEVDISRRQVPDALVVPEMIVVGDEVADLLLEVTGEIIVLEQDAVLERLASARGSPIVLMKSLMQSFCSAKTCSTRARICDFVAFPLAIGFGIGLPLGFL